MRLPTLGTLCAILGLLAAAAGCASVKPAEPDPLAPWPSFNGGSTYSCVLDRSGWHLNVPRVEDDDARGAEFRERVLADLPAAIAQARTVLQQDPEDTRLAKLLWALLDRKEAEVLLLAWDVLERQSWKEDQHAAAFSSLILQVRIDPRVSDDERRRAFALLVPLANTPRQQANLATLALRQSSLGSLPPECTVALAQLLLVEPGFFNIGRTLVAGGNEFPSGIGNTRPWCLFMLAGRASVPQLAEDLFHESREIRVGAQWCLERILVTRLKDLNYSADSPPEELRLLRDKGLVHELKAMAR